MRCVLLRIADYESACVNVMVVTMTTILLLMMMMIMIKSKSDNVSEVAVGT
jgi:hypothetical protein